MNKTLGCVAKFCLFRKLQDGKEQRDPHAGLGQSAPGSEEKPQMLQCSTDGHYYGEQSMGEKERQSGSFPVYRSISEDARLPRSGLWVA